MARWTRIKNWSRIKSLNSLQWIKEKSTSSFCNSSSDCLSNKENHFRNFDSFCISCAVFKHFSYDWFMYIYADSGPCRKTLGTCSNKLAARFQRICILFGNDLNRTFYWSSNCKSGCIHYWMDHCGDHFDNFGDQFSSYCLHDIHFCKTTRF